MVKSPDEKKSPSPTRRGPKKNKEHVENPSSTPDGDPCLMQEQPVEAYLPEQDDSYFESQQQFEAPVPMANQLVVTLPYGLINQLKSLARQEGVNVEDVLVDLAMDGMRRRQVEDGQRGGPSHLQTRNGYMASDVDGYTAPTMSHHQSQQRNKNNNNRNFGSRYGGNGNANGNQQNGRFQQRQGNGQRPNFQRNNNQHYQNRHNNQNYQNGQPNNQNNQGNQNSNNGAPRPVAPRRDDESGNE